MLYVYGVANENINYALLNVNGIAVQTGLLHDTREVMVSDISDGLYLLMLTAPDGHTSVRRFIILRN